MIRQITGLALLLAFTARGRDAVAKPFDLQYGGRLTAGDGSALAGPVELDFKFFDSATVGNQLGPDFDVPSVPLVDGVFTVPLALAGAPAQAVFGGGVGVWVEVTDVTHQKTYPRQQLSAVPYALRVPVDGSTIKFDNNGDLTVPPPPAPPTANGSQPGYLAAADWAQFNAAPTKAYVDGLNTAETTSISAVSAAALKKDGSVALTGSLNAGAQDVTNVGNIQMLGSKSFLLSVATSDPAGLGPNDKGRIWYNGGIRLWNGTSAQSLGISGAGVQALNGLNDNVQNLANGTAGTAPGWVSASPTHTLNIPLAATGGVTQGLVSNADWLLFNGKQNVLPAANAVTNGFLTGGDWAVFNAKQPLLPPGSLTANGYIASADWAAFNAKQNALGAATSGSLGYLTAGDWATFNGREPALAAGAAGQYYRSDKTWAALNTTAVAEATNLYYTSTRAQGDARNAVNATGPLQYVGGTGTFSMPPATVAASGYLASSDWANFNSKQNALAAASAVNTGYLTSADWANFAAKQGALNAAGFSGNGYLASADWATFNAKDPFVAAGGTSQYYRGDKVWQTLNSGAVTESTNLYFTAARAVAALSSTAPVFANMVDSGVAASSIVKTNGSQQLAAATAADVTTLIGSATYVAKGGDTMTGALAFPVSPKSGAYTLTANDSVIIADATTAAFTLTLPAAATATGRRYSMKKKDATTHAVTIAANGGESIDGSPTFLLDAQYQTVTIDSDGTGWYVTYTNKPTGTGAGGRLTLTSATPVTNADVTAATILYYTPHKTNLIALSDASSVWTTYAFVEASLNTASLTANTNYDVFGYWSAGALAIEALAWTNGTTRATALARQTNGVYLKSTDLTRRFLGTVHVTGVAGQLEDSLRRRLVWNQDNRTQRPVSAVDATASWALTAAAWQMVNGNGTNMRVELVSGLGEDAVSLVYTGMVGNNNASADTTDNVVAEDVTTVANSIYASHSSCSLNSGWDVTCVSTFNRAPVAGYHYYQAFEYGNSPSMVSYGSSIYSSLHGTYSD